MRLETTDGDAAVAVSVLDEAGDIVASASGASGRLSIPEVRLWQPRNAYLYTLRVDVSADGVLADRYDEPFGVRRVEVRGGRFLLNEKLFYFKGFGKHEDAGTGRARRVSTEGLGSSLEGCNEDPILLWKVHAVVRREGVRVSTRCARSAQGGLQFALPCCAGGSQAKMETSRAEAHGVNREM
jgi:hypothetical protein